MKSPTVSIGLPTYNRPAVLAQTLENLCNQTFEDFELIVSDNASSDPAVRALVERAMRGDRRIRYIRHDRNRGAEANFWFVFREGTAPFFLWAADDDLRPLSFIERGVAALRRSASSGGWFCRVENINREGLVNRHYPSFARFASTAKPRELVRFLWEPEIMGKANLIYSIYRREAIVDVVETFSAGPTCWGCDMAIVYGFLCRNNLIVEDDLVFKKRIQTDEQAIDIDDPRKGIYPWEHARAYFRSYLDAARGTPYEALTAATLTARWVFDVGYHYLKLRRRVPLFPPPIGVSRP